MVAHAYSPITQKADTGGSSQLQSQTELQSVTLSQTKQNKHRRKLQLLEGHLQKNLHLKILNGENNVLLPKPGSIT